MNKLKLIFVLLLTLLAGCSNEINSNELEWSELKCVNNGGVRSIKPIVIAPLQVYCENGAMFHMMVEVNYQ